MLTLSDQSTIALDASGTATWIYSAISVGNMTLDAVFDGDHNNAPSTGSVVVAVNKASPSVILTSNLKRIAVGGRVKVSISLLGFQGFTGGVVLTLSDNTSVTVKPCGHAMWSHTATTAATTSTLAASFNGDASNEATSGSEDITVTEATPTLLLTADPKTVEVGKQVKVILTLSGYFGPTQGLELSLSDGSSVTLDASGTATWKFLAATAGITTLSASYAGDYNNVAAIGSVGITVTQALPTMALKAGSTKATIGGQVRGSLGFCPYR